MRITTVCLLLSAALIAVVTSVAVAGPPMICHPVEVGDAECLPWGDKPFEKSRGFKTSELVGRTIKALEGSSSAIMHMEALRRAALYSERDTELATQLIGALTARALDAEIAGDPDVALAVMDAGYLAQCYDQLGVRTGVSFGTANGIVGWDVRNFWDDVSRKLDAIGRDVDRESVEARITARVPGPDQFPAGSSSSARRASSMSGSVCNARR